MLAEQGNQSNQVLTLTVPLSAFSALSTPLGISLSTLPIGTPRKAARRLTEAPSQHPSDTEERRRERDKEEKVSSPHTP